MLKVKVPDGFIDETFISLFIDMRKNIQAGASNSGGKKNSNLLFIKLFWVIN